LLLESEERVARLEGMVDDLQRRLAEEATQRRAIEDELARLRDELSLLKR
jgi:hypothetical protein